MLFFMSILFFENRLKLCSAIFKFSRFEPYIICLKYSFYKNSVDAQKIFCSKNLIFKQCAVLRYTLTSKNFGPINFGHFIFEHKIFGRNIRKFRTKFRTNFKSVQIFSDNHFYSRISFLNEDISYFLLLMPIESLKTKGFHMEEVILQTR